MFECVQYKAGNGITPENIGYDAHISFNRDNELVIYAGDNKEIFRHSADELQVYYHQSLNGINLVYDEDKTVILYYTRVIKAPKG